MTKLLQDPPPPSRMLPAIPILCPLCSRRLKKAAEQEEPSRHIFTCTNASRNCVHLTCNTDWSLREISFYVSNGIVLVRITSTHMLLRNQLISFPNVNLFDLSPALETIKTFLIFS